MVMYSFGTISRKLYAFKKVQIACDRPLQIQKMRELREPREQLFCNKYFEAMLSCFQLLFKISRLKTRCWEDGKELYKWTG